MNGYGSFVATWDFGAGVRYSCAFPTFDRRREVMEHVLEGRQEGRWKIKTSDGTYRLLGDAIACWGVDVVERRRSAA